MIYNIMIDLLKQISYHWDPDALINIIWNLKKYKYCLNLIHHSSDGMKVVI